MRYIKFTYSNGYCGCDEEIYEAFEDGVSDSEIEEYGYDGIQMYSFYEPDDRFVSEDDYDSEDEYMDAYDEYQENIDVSWEEVSKEEFEEYA